MCSSNLFKAVVVDGKLGFEHFKDFAGVQVPVAVHVHCFKPRFWVLSRGGRRMGGERAEGDEQGKNARSKLIFVSIMERHQSLLAWLTIACLF